jgi:hypothetical protein
MLSKRLYQVASLVFIFYLSLFSFQLNLSAQNNTFNPLGNYSLTTRVMGIQEIVQIHLEVLQINGDYIANARTDIAPEISPSVPIVVTGRQLSYKTTTPNGSLSITFLVDENDAIKGTWEFGLFLRGNLTGKRLTERPPRLHFDSTKEN